MPMIGERFREWLKPLLMKKGLGLMEDGRAMPCKRRIGGYPPARWNLARIKKAGARSISRLPFYF